MASEPYFNIVTATYNLESARYATDAMLRLIILRHRSLIQSLLSCSKVPSRHNKVIAHIGCSE